MSTPQFMANHLLRAVAQQRPDKPVAVEAKDLRLIGIKIPPDVSIHPETGEEVETPVSSNRPVEILVSQLRAACQAVIDRAAPAPKAKPAEPKS